jgi:lysyl-tRNA synthetase class 2
MGDPFPLSALRLRSAVLQAIRTFFVRHDFLEVETPVLIAAPALEQHIDAVPAGPHYLRTSPELHMKRLLADGAKRIFQLGPCFRLGERGSRHNPEFTMLEWYRADADYLDILADAKALLACVAQEAIGRTSFTYAGHPVELLPLWDCLSVSEAYLLHAGWDPVAAYDADRFDLDLVDRVEPALPRDRPVVLKDYPPEAAALARCRPGPPRVAERWELYVAGMELANAFSELTDAAEQRRRFEDCAARRRAAGHSVYPMDESFLQALARGLPPCGGAALGVDRLTMLFADASAIEEVRPFTDEPA